MQKTVFMALTLEQQIEIERIIMDNDKEAALELVKQIRNKIQKEDASQMKRDF